GGVADVDCDGDLFSNPWGAGAVGDDDLDRCVRARRGIPAERAAIRIAAVPACVAGTCVRQFDDLLSILARTPFRVGAPEVHDGERGEHRDRDQRNQTHRIEHRDDTRQTQPLAGRGPAWSRHQRDRNRDRQCEKEDHVRTPLQRERVDALPGFGATRQRTIHRQGYRQSGDGQRRRSTPCSRAIDTAWSLECAPSCFRTDCTWVRTVFKLTVSSAAMALFDAPLSTRVRMSRSLLVRIPPTSPRARRPPSLACGNTASPACTARTADVSEAAAFVFST